MERKPLVSVIIPTFNPDKYILRALKSAISQDYSNIEILIIDDGSKIDVKNTIKKYLDMENVFYYKQNNKGPASARNFGVEKSNGELIAFLDDDDEWFSNKLSEQIAFMSKNKLDCVISGLISQNISKNTSKVKKNKLPNSKKKTILKFFYGHINEITPTILVKKKCFKKIGGFNEKLFRKEDHYFMMQMILKYRVKSLEKPLYKRFRRDEGLSSNTKPSVLLENTKIYLDLCKKELNISIKNIKKYQSIVYGRVAYYYFQNKNYSEYFEFLKKSLNTNLFNMKVYVFILLTPLLFIKNAITK